MMTRQALGALLAVFVLGACRAPGSGATSIRVEGCSWEEEVRIREQEWMIEKALQEVLVRYDMRHLNLDVVVEELGGLGETKPEFDLFLQVRGGRVSINKLLFLEDNPEKEAILLGLFAHEVAHALHYARLSEIDLLTLAERYERFYRHPEGHLMPWARAYEQFTDLTAIAYGFAEPLAQQKVRSEGNVSKNHPKKVWNFYLRPAEIEALAGDRSALEDRIDAALEEIGLESLRRFAAGLPLEGIPEGP